MPLKPNPPPKPPPPRLHHWFDGPRCPNQAGYECKCTWFQLFWFEMLVVLSLLIVVMLLILI